MTYTSARRRFVAISLRNSQPSVSVVVPLTAASDNAAATMRIAAAAAATHRSVYTSDSGWFRTAATAVAPLQAKMVVPKASSAPISTSMRRYGASKNPLLFRYNGQQLQSFSKRPYSTTPPLAAIVETTETETATAATGSPVHAAATQQWRELLFGGLLAVTLTGTLVFGFPQTPAQAAAHPATAEATQTTSSSNSNSNGPAHVTFRPTPKSSNINKNGGGSNGGGAVMLSTQPLGEATSKNKNNSQISPHPVSNSGRSPYDVSVSMTKLGQNFIRLVVDCCVPRK
jgi:hypothetical protein